MFYFNGELILNKKHKLSNLIDKSIERYNNQFHLYKFLDNLEKIIREKISKKVLNNKNEKLEKLINIDKSDGAKKATFDIPFTIGIINQKTLEEINEIIKADLIPFFIKEEKQKYLLTKNDFVDWWLADDLKDEK